MKLQNISSWLPTVFFVLGVWSSSQLKYSGFSLKATYLLLDYNHVLSISFAFYHLLLQHSFMAERLPGKIETEPQYVIKFFAQWKLVIDTMKPLASESTTEGMNSITKEHSFQEGFPKSWDLRDLPAFLVSWQKFKIRFPSKTEKNSCLIVSCFSSINLFTAFSLFLRIQDIGGKIKQFRNILFKPWGKKSQNVKCTFWHRSI